MVVVRKTESKLSSANDYIEDLLIIPVSETESLDEDVNPTPRSSHQRFKNGAFATSLTFIHDKACGKRKRRQHENFLDLLSKGPVDIRNPTIHDFFPMGHRSLISLLEECSIVEAFCYGCEDFFEKFEDSHSQHRNESQRKLRSRKGIDAQTTVLHFRSPDHSLLEMKALLRVEESVRCAVVSGSIPQDLVRELEGKLVQFFVNNPREIYASRGFSSMERTVLYAICNFHLLIYKCYRKRRYHLVQVRNANYTFEEPSVHLSDILLKCENSDNSELLKK